MPIVNKVNDTILVRLAGIADERNFFLMLHYLLAEWTLCWWSLAVIGNEWGTKGKPLVITETSRKGCSSFSHSLLSDSVDNWRSSRFRRFRSQLRVQLAHAHRTYGQIVLCPFNRTRMLSWTQHLKHIGFRLLETAVT